MSATSVLACPVCGQAHRDEPLPRGTSARCVRCGSKIASATANGLHRTAALALAALILYIPANLFPILRMSQYGVSTENTVWQGSKLLFQDGDYVIALIVFLASILIPLLKLLGLFYLVFTTRRGHTHGRHLRTKIFRAIEIMGRWAMLDVFVLAVLVSLVKLQGLATVTAGPGLFAFSLVVVLTLLASASFDGRLIWEPERVPRDGGPNT